MKVAGKVGAQNEAGWAAQLKEWGNSESDVQWKMNQRKREGNCPFVFAPVPKPRRASASRRTR